MGGYSSQDKLEIPVKGNVFSQFPVCPAPSWPHPPVLTSHAWATICHPCALLTVSLVGTLRRRGAVFEWTSPRFRTCRGAAKATTAQQEAEVSDSQLACFPGRRWKTTSRIHTYSTVSSTSALNTRTLISSDIFEWSLQLLTVLPERRSWWRGEHGA